MKLPVVWLPEAEYELKEALAWYQRVNPDLATRFELSVEETIQTMASTPLRFPVVYKNRRRASVRRFPYGIFFQISENRIVVIACFHGRRDPKHWRQR